MKVSRQMVKTENSYLYSIHNILHLCAMWLGLFDLEAFCHREHKHRYEI